MFKIDSVKFGEIRIEGKDYYSDMFVFWDGKVEFREKGHQITLNDIRFLVKRKPYAIVIGKGMQGAVSVLPEVRQALEDKKIKLFSDLTPNAVEIFNGLIAQGKKVVGIFHVTC